MLDRAVLATRVQGLENNQNGVLFLRIQQGLQLNELLPVSLQFRRRRLVCLMASFEGGIGVLEIEPPARIDDHLFAIVHGNSLFLGLYLTFFQRGQGHEQPGPAIRFLAGPERHPRARGRRLIFEGWRLRGKTVFSRASMLFTSKPDVTILLLLQSRPIFP